MTGKPAKLNLALLFSCLTAISACASLGKDDVRENNIQIKRINSEYAVIGAVNLKRTASGFYLRGEIRRRMSRRGAIPGYLDIEIIKPDGITQYSQKVGYMRRNRHSAYSRFALPIGIELTAGSVIQIRHYATANIVAHGKY